MNRRDRREAARTKGKEFSYAKYQKEKAFKQRYEALMEAKKKLHPKWQEVLADHVPCWATWIARRIPPVWYRFLYQYTTIKLLPRVLILHKLVAVIFWTPLIRLRDMFGSFGVWTKMEIKDGRMHLTMRHWGSIVLQTSVDI